MSLDLHCLRELAGRRDRAGAWTLPLLQRIRVGLAVVLGYFANLCSGAEPIPAIAPPVGSTALVRDGAANFWGLAPAKAGGERELLVLPAQSPSQWIKATISGLPTRAWSGIVPQKDRSILLSDERSTFRFDPRYPERGAREITSGSLTPEGASLWRTVGRMPASNHDITAATLGGKLYVAGGITSDHGFPARSQAFDQIWELDGRTWHWRIVATFERPRIYCATVAFADQVWVLGGDILTEAGERRPTTLVNVFDPATGALSRAPDLPVALPAPVALVAGGRLWVVGARDRMERGQMASIGKGETVWRVEPEALPRMWALAGAALGEELYLLVPDTGLAVFDPVTKQWRLIPGPSQPRSSQVAAWHGELWIMGGCDRADWSETHIYNPQLRTWRTGPSLPLPLAWGAAAVLNDQLVVTGGAGLHGPVEERNYVFNDQTFVLDRSLVPPSSPVASLQGLQRWSNVNLRGTGGAGLPFTTTRIFPQFKFRRLTTIQSIPTLRPDEPERLLVAEVHGPVWTFPNRPDVTAPDRLLDLPQRFQASTHTYALAFHPQYPREPYVYVLYNRVEPKPAENVLARFTVTQTTTPTIDVGTEQVILRWPSDGHNGGDVRFGPDGYLYVSVGDRGPPGDPHNMGQRVDVIAGGVLRLDVLRPEAGKNYSIPSDNPFVGVAGVRPEFWAYGLRNPWRMWFGAGGELWLGDNGDDSWESIHRVQKGANFGWSVFEGKHPFKRTRSLAGPTPRLTPPVLELSHAEARSIIGGLWYPGTKYPELAGQNVFGDFVTGSIWAFAADGAEVKQFRRIADARGSPIAFGTNRAGEILITREDGEIHRLIAAPPVSAPTAKIPARLSETGIFADTAGLRPAPGMLPYEINAAPWADGAVVRRAFGVSGVHSITVDSGGDGTWTLPDGSAAVRTLVLPTPFGSRRVETQLMYREQGSWQFYTYAWNEAQTDAELVPEAGEVRRVPGLANRTWRYSSRSECIVCHHRQTTLGLSTAQLNRDADLSGLRRGVVNQITATAETGLLGSGPNTTPDLLSRKVSPTDERQSIASRARSYLSINCGHCHQAGGVGGRAAFQLLDSVSLEQAGVIHGQPLVPLLGAGAKIVSPGDPDRSELVHRMSLPSGGRMPLIGSDVPDTEGIALIRAWVQQMPR